ncbi:hypothetical protein DN402_21470 [Streptomyces sp. SW4]|nr:hypothetical protein DN402_21470 [Streptomyces sp. SW4]
MVRPAAHGRPTGPGHPADHAADYPAEHAAGHPAEQRDGAVAAPEGPAGPSAEPFPAPASRRAVPPRPGACGSPWRPW